MGANNSVEKAYKRIDKQQKKLRELENYFENDRIKRESEIPPPPTRPAPTPPPRRQAPKPPPTRPAPQPPQRTRKRKPYVIGQNDEPETEEDYEVQGRRTQQPPQQPRAPPQQSSYDPYEGYTVQSAGGYNPNDYGYGYGYDNHNGGYSNNNGGYSNDVYSSNNNDPYEGYTVQSAGGYNPNDYGYGYNNHNGGYSNDVYSSNNNGYQHASNNNNPEGCFIM